MARTLNTCTRAHKRTHAGWTAGSTAASAQASSPLGNRQHAAGHYTCSRGLSRPQSLQRRGGGVLPSCAHPAPHPHTNTHTTTLCATEADDTCSTTHRTRIMHACVPMGEVHRHTQCLDRGRSGGGGVGEGSHDGSCCQPQARTCSFATGVALLMWHRVVQSSSAAVPCSTSQSQAAHTLS